VNFSIKLLDQYATGAKLGLFNIVKDRCGYGHVVLKPTKASKIR
jgi:hypothetical protein